jgi:hypothetical protein
MASNQVVVNMDDLKTLVRETVLEVLAETAEQRDPDAGLSFKPEVAEYLEKYLAEHPKSTPLQYA